MDLDPDLTALAATGVYLVVLGFVFVESGLLVGFFLPGDSILFGAGLIAGASGSGVSVWVLVVGATLAAVAGDAVGYWTGRRLGRPLLERRAARRGIDPALVGRAEAFYRRYGWWSVVVARWIPWVRTFTPVAAGTARMPYGSFLSANVVGALCWAAGLVTVGYWSHAVPGVRDVAVGVGAFFVLASFAGGGLAWWRARRQRRTPQPPSR